jgi:hypothetical protein
MDAPNGAEPGVNPSGTSWSMKEKREREREIELLK